MVILKCLLKTKNFQRALWSYDIEKMDTEKDKEEIITQMLNHGNSDDLRQLFEIYSDEEIKEIVKNPRRGVWFEKVLNFWTTIFNIRLKKNVRERAIFNINPH